MPDTRRPLLLLILGLILFIASGIPAFMANMAAFAETTYTLNAPGIQDVTYEGQSIAGTRGDGTVTIAASELPWQGNKPWQRFDVLAVYATHTENQTFLVLGKWVVAGSAGLGLLLIVLAAPAVLFRSTHVLRTDTNAPVSGWYYLLAEPQGLSLSRVQLIIWFLPAILCYALLAWPVHQFPDIPSSLLPLLGLGGATSALSSAISHPAGAASASTDGGGGGGQPATPPSPSPAPAAAPLQTVQAAYRQAAVSVQSAPPAGGATPAPSTASAGNWPPPDNPGGSSTEPAATTQPAGQSTPTGQPVTAMESASLGGQVPAGATLTPEVLAQAFVLAMQQAQQNQAAAQQTAPAPVPTAPPVYVQPPRLSDMVEDFSGYGDISRYQYLMLCLIAAAVFFVTFLQTWQVPTLPDQFVPLVATSQATYLVVKGIKYVRDPKAKPQQ